MSNFDDEDLLQQTLDDVEDKLFFQDTSEMTTKEYKACILQLLRVQQGSKSIFSSNETSLKEYDSNLWRFLLTSYYISHCFQNCSADMNDEPDLTARQQIRERFLKQALTHMKAFDDKMLQFKIIPNAKMRIFNDNLNGGSNSDAFEQMMNARDLKIQRMKIQKERSEQLKLIHDEVRHLTSRRDQNDQDVQKLVPLQRKFATLMFHQALDDCKEQYAHIQQELQMIEMFIQRSKDSHEQTRQQQRQMLSQQRAPSKQTFQNVKQLSRSDSTDRTIKHLESMGVRAINLEEQTNQRQEIIDRMFAPFNPATKTLEEFAEEEMRNLHERQERTKQVEDERKRKEAEKKDPDEETDEEVQEKRNWDDWKDDNPKGAGNLKR